MFCPCLAQIDAASATSPFLGSEGLFFVNSVPTNFSGRMSAQEPIGQSAFDGAFSTEEVVIQDVDVRRWCSCKRKAHQGGCRTAMRNDAPQQSGMYFSKAGSLICVCRDRYCVRRRGGFVFRQVAGTRCGITATALCVDGTSFVRIVGLSALAGPASLTLLFRC